MAAEEVTGGKMIILERKVKAGEERGKQFEVSEAAAARLSVVLRDAIPLNTTQGSILLPDINNDATLGTVAKYLNAHANADAEDCGLYTAASEGLAKKDAELVNDLDKDGLFNVMEAADCLFMDGLLDAACKKVADMMKDKTPEQIREIFNIPDDFTEEEKEEIREEYAWAFPKENRSSSSTGEDEDGGGDEDGDRDEDGGRDEDGHEDGDEEDYGDEDDADYDDENDPDYTDEDDDEYGDEEQKP